MIETSLYSYLFISFIVSSLNVLEVVKAVKADRVEDIVTERFEALKNINLAHAPEENDELTPDVGTGEAEDGTITVYTEPTDLHKALEALRANGQEEFQVTELEMIPQTEVTLEGEDLETFKGLIDALEADDDVQKVYHNVADM